MTQWEIPIKAAELPLPKQTQMQTFDANALIAEAERAAKEAKEAETRRIEEEEREQKREREERHRRKKEEKEEKERAQREKKVMGLFSAVVVSTMSKYRSQFEADAFKKRAKEVSGLSIE
jgi:histone-lysine N-methyltransferase SETD2